MWRLKINTMVCGNCASISWHCLNVWIGVINYIFDYITVTLKGQCHKIFCFRSFHESPSPQAPENNFRVISYFFENSQIYSQVKVHLGVNDTGGKFATGINDNGGKFATSSACVVDTVGKFATGVNDTSSKFAAGVNDAGGKLPLVSTTPKKGT